jgi:hypothetical protein
MRKTTARKAYRFRGKPQNPLEFAVETWDRAISAVDHHSRVCVACGKRVHRLDVARATGTLGVLDPYGLCGKAEGLYAGERRAMEEYRKLGGLPTREGR